MTTAWSSVSNEVTKPVTFGCIKTAKTNKIKIHNNILNRSTTKWTDLPHHYSIAQVEVLYSIVRLASVDVEAEAVAGLGVAYTPQIHPPLDQFFRHILFPGQSTIEANHRLVDGDVLSWSKASLEVAVAHVFQGSYFRQLVACQFFTSHRTMKVLAQFLIPATRHHTGIFGVRRSYSGFRSPTPPRNAAVDIVDMPCCCRHCCTTTSRTYSAKTSKNLGLPLQPIA